VPFTGKEERWRTKVAVVLVVLGKCTRRFAQSAKKNAKFLSNLEKAEGLFYAESVMQRVRVRAVK
jgi:hypothetical protein